MTGSDTSSTINPPCVARVYSFSTRAFLAQTRELAEDFDSLWGDFNTQIHGVVGKTGSVDAVTLRPVLHSLHVVGRGFLVDALSLYEEIRDGERSLKLIPESGNLSVFKPLEVAYPPSPRDLSDGSRAELAHLLLDR